MSAGHAESVRLISTRASGAKPYERNRSGIKKSSIVN